MRKLNIAIAGLGRVGSEFLKALLEVSSDTVRLAAVAEPREELPSVKLAKERGIAYFKDARDMLRSLEDMVDILFDLTGDALVKSDLHEIIVKTGNKRTLIVPEPVAFLIWSIIKKE
ncbi:MAG: serine kinase [Aquificaceae bacterium]|nr:serine kinase [Aquificaceae bacterium]